MKERRATLDDIENNIIDLLAEHITLKGVSSKSARVYAFMYVRQRITQRELQAATGYSAGSISASLTILERYGAVVKTRNKASRQFEYSLAGTITQIGRILLDQSQESIQRRIEFFKKLDQRLDNPALVGKNGYESVHTFVEQIRQFLPAYEVVRQALDAMLKKQAEGGS